jgi:hypothetical protein
MKASLKPGLINRRRDGENFANTSKSSQAARKA